jgi:polyhydroxyalkanoate synthase subunit PhaC
MSDNGHTPVTEPLRTVEALGPEAALVLSHVDPLGFIRALGDVGKGLVENPVRAAEAWARFAADVALAAVATGARVLGADVEGPATPAPKDRRFADPTWTENHAYYLLHQNYLLGGRLLKDLVAASGVTGSPALKADFAVQQLIDALAPTNTLLNPAALKRALETGGTSLIRGLRNFLSDLATNEGYPRQVDRSAFTVGEDLAVTPGKVVVRNELMELIQYEAQTDTVHDVPLLLSPPWINKYYVMDLAPTRSFAEWAVTHGHTTFAISYRNPPESLRDKSIEDYVVNGPLVALEAMEAITGSSRANIVGLCLGGTLTAMTLAHLAKTDPGRVNAATLLNTIVDFSEPGVLGTFTDEATIAHIERQNAKWGFQPASEMASTFTLLRANDLVWNYVVNNWLLGDKPSAFDILSWNDDATRTPAALHSFLLRSCYQRNDFAQGRLSLGDEQLDPRKIPGHIYILNAVEDHIAPWRTGYATTRVLDSAQPRFVLTSSGHIAGIVNPPSPKSAYWTNDELPADPEEWRANATKHQGSWWEDWAAWIGERGGELRTPPPLGAKSHPPVGDAPGVYVHER